MKRAAVLKYKYIIISAGAIMAMSALVIVSVGQHFSANQKEYGKTIARTCRDLAEEAKSRCWGEMLQSLFEGEGADTAFRAIAYLYAADPNFPQSCYAITRSLGSWAAQRFPAYELITITPSTIFCNYGFYHQFAETLLRTTADLKKAREFCAWSGRALSQEAPGVRPECYRGLGRGTVHFKVADPENEREIVNSALKRCKVLAETEAERDICVSGLFNRFSDANWRSKRGLAVKKEDPLWICREQEKHHQPHCYGNMHRLLLDLVEKKSDLSAVAALAKKIYGGSDPATSSVIQFFSHSRAITNLTQTDHSGHVRLCRTLAKNLWLPCLQGYSVGLAKNGKPGEQYVAMLRFCLQPTLSKEEQTGCLQVALPYLRGLYPQEKFMDICSAVGRKQKEFCSQELKRSLSIIYY